jgi:hypothetical protein
MVYSRRAPGQGLEALEAIELDIKWRNGERPISRQSWREFKRQQ